MSRAQGNDVPFIDPRVDHVGVSRLRSLDAKALKENTENNRALVIREHDEPLAVLLSYEQYLIIQNQLRAVMESMEILTNSDEVRLLIAGIHEANSGNVTPLEEIRKSLKHHTE